MNIRSLALFAILLEVVTATTQFTSEYNEKKDHGPWLAAEEKLAIAHGHERVYEHPLQLSAFKQEAWAFSKLPGNGPFYYAGNRKDSNSVYVLTKVPGTSQLGESMGLQAPEPSKNAFMFWKVGTKTKVPVLLAAQVRDVGAPLPDSMTLEEVIERAKRARV